MRMIPELVISVRKWVISLINALIIPQLLLLLEAVAAATTTAKRVLSVRKKVTGQKNVLLALNRCISVLLVYYSWTFCIKFTK